MTLTTALHTVRTQRTEHQQTAHAEGNNIMSWIGFKHIMYLAEEAVLAHFRQAGLGMRHLFEEYGLLLEIVSNEGRILHALKLDELVSTSVKPVSKAQGNSLRFEVVMHVERAGKPVKTYAGVVALVFKQDRSLGMTPEPCELGDLAAWVVEKAIDPAAPTPTTQPGYYPDRAHLAWDFVIPYFYCHGNQRLKMSGYLRLLEEADARFCAQQGIDVCELLLDRRWIPAVPSAKVSIVEEAYMNETLHLLYTVTDVIKSLLYKSSMQAWVERNGQKVWVAQAEIVHAYAQIHSRKDWGMVNFDTQVLHAIGADQS